MDDTLYITSASSAVSTWRMHATLTLHYHNTVKVKVSSSQHAPPLKGTHMPYEITQCYLPPGRADNPALTPAETGTRLSDPGGMQG